jgi:DNA (cytosine-5)-methyltransferase 1
MIRMIAIDLFSGAGGMSLGAEQAGFSVCLAVDSDKHATKTYKHNHPAAKVLTTDIRNINKHHLPKTESSKLLFGGPPCQGFSTSNQRTRSLDNPSNWLFLEFLRIVKLWEPDWVVIENVKGITETKKGFFLNEIVKRLENYHYVNASNFGVPQNRNRLFIVGSRKGIIVKKPKNASSLPVTVHDAISDLPVLHNDACENRLPYKGLPKSRYAKSMRKSMAMSSNHLVTKSSPLILERYSFVPQGGNWQNIPEQLMNNYSDRSRCHTGIYHRLEENQPSVVLGNFRKNMLIHPHYDRGLSVREAARLQSFPDWYEFVGSIGFQQQQVGNAVPPLLAKKVFTAIKKHIQ